MDDLEGNPLYRAFLTRFRREFDIACKMSYLIAIPHSDSLENVGINQFLANAHILMPSKLLKMHYTPLQAGHFEDIEIENNKLFCYLSSKGTAPNNRRLVVKILAEEIGYNANNREYKTILIDRPLIDSVDRSAIMSILMPLSPMTSAPQRFKIKPARPLRSHDDCSKYLENISHDITQDMENDVRRMQSNYMILAHYLDDAAERIKSLAESYADKYELSLESKGHSICDIARQAIRLSVENYIVYLMHGKLMASIYSRHEKHDRILLEKFNQIYKSKLTICQLGAQSAFADFILSDDIFSELQRLPTLQSPLAIVTSLVKLAKLISEGLNQSVRFKQLIGDANFKDNQVSICSDDLIATFVYSLARAKPTHLYSISKYIEMFSWSSSAKDQAAYYTATFQIVVQYVYSYTSEDANATQSPDSQLCLASPSSNKSSSFILGAPAERKARENNTSDNVERSHPYVPYNSAQFIDSLDSRGSSFEGPESTHSSANESISHGADSVRLR